MAIPFLNNINLSDNQLQNAKLHITGTAPTAAAAQIYFDSSDTIAKYYSNATDTWVSLVQTDFANGTFISLTNGGTSIKRAYTVDLSAVDGTSTSASRFLTKDNTWATIPFGDITAVLPGTYINIDDSTGPEPTVNHDLTTRTDTTSTGSPGYAGTFTVVDSVTTNTTGHITALNVKTVTMPSSEAYTFSVTADSGTNQPIDSGNTLDIAGGTNITTVVGATDTVTVNLDDTITLQGNLTVGGMSTFNDEVTIDADASITGDLDMNTAKIVNLADPTANQDAATKKYVDDEIAGVPQGTLTGLGEGTYIDIDNTTPAVPIINVEGTEAATASKLVARDSNGYGYVATPASGDSSTKIATTAFVQSSLTGLLEFKGGFNASTGAIVGGGNLTSGATRVAVAVGDYYVVTVDGDFFGNTATPLTVGDSVIVQTAAEAGASVEGDFIVVQSDTDLATETTVGLGNVNIEGAGDKDGLSLSYSSGTATLGLDINSLTANDATDDPPSNYSVPFYSSPDGENYKITIAEILDLGLSANSWSGTIGNGSLTSLPIPNGTHQLGADSSSFMIQLVEVSSGETVYADVTRGASGLVTIDFAAAPASNAIRVLIQKIG